MNSKVFDLNSISSEDFQKTVNALKSGKIGVIPTDTIYGIVGSALNQQAVEQIYTLRKRTPSKPMIILISSLEDLGKFDVTIDEQTTKLLHEIWPNPVSVILACPESRFEYLHRETNTLAFRLPKNKFLLKLLKETGPLVAPSANFEGEPPALTVPEAQAYFGDNVEMYVNAGNLESEPSTIIDITSGIVRTVRQGAFKISL